jgi:hypothetical protein
VNDPTFIVLEETLIEFAVTVPFPVKNPELLATALIEVFPILMTEELLPKTKDVEFTTVFTEELPTVIEVLTTGLV